MKKHFLLPALLLVGFTTVLTSCKKNKDDAVNPSIEACKVDYATTSTDSTQITYDSENRVIKEQSFDNTDNSQGYTLYSYSSDKIVEEEYDESGDLVSKTDYHLNSNNNASYSVYVEDGNTDAADTTWYTYDSNKHNTRRVTKHTTPIIGNAAVRTYDTTWYTYSGANLSKVEEKNQGEDVQTTVYSYGSDEAKSQFLAPGQDSDVLGLYGNPSEKLPVSATMGATTVSYIYEFNDKGYVTRYKIMNGAITGSDVHFKYNCR